MNEHDRERWLQELWELEFGCHEEPQRLLEEVRRNRELQSLREEVAAQAATLREAAREDTAELDLPHFAPPERLDRRWFWTRGRRRRFAVALAAGLLIWLGFAGNLGFRAWRQSQVATDTLSVRVTSPRGSVALREHAFTIEVRNAAGEERSAAVTYQAFDAADEPIGELRRITVDGSSRVVVPASERRPARLVVRAPTVPGAEELDMTLVGSEATPLIHLRPDRPLYQPGETARVRVTMLDRVTLEPQRQPLRLRATVLDPRGDVVHGPEYLAIGTDSGNGGLTWTVPEHLPGGRYRIEVSGGQTERLAETSVVVRRYQRDRLAKRVVLGRASYGPGETGSASLHVEQLGQGPAEGAEIFASLWLDGREVWQQPGVLDLEGRARFDFEIPLDVERGAARFVARVTHGGLVETAVQPFVVPTGKLDVHLLPESGTLVAGASNRVYVAVTDPLDREVSASGALVDDAGKEVARFATTHGGRTRLEFTPEAGRRYHLRVDEPLPGESDAHPARESAVALRSLHDLQPGGQPLRVRIERGADSGDDALLVGAFCRGALVGQATLDAGRGSGDVSVPLDDRVTGVLRITVFDRDLRPLAERLVRRAAHRPLRVDVAPQLAVATPGARQTLDLIARHSDGRPAAGVVLGVTVTDRQNWTRLGLEPIGLRDSVELLGDVATPNDPRGLLLGHDDADRNADLLLGTRGWRRLLWDGDEARRAALSELGEEYVAVAERVGPLTTPQAVDSSHVVEQRRRQARWARREARDSLHGITGLLLVVAGLFALFDSMIAVGRRVGVHPAVSLGTTVVVLLIGTFVFSGPTLEWVARTPAIEDAAAGRAAEAKAENEAPFLFDDGGADAVRYRAVMRQAANGDNEAELFELQRPADGLVAGSVRRPVRGDWFHRGDGNPAVRDNFPETLAFTIANRTDADGRLQLQFDLGEQVTTWQVDVDAHHAGRIGQAQTRFDSRLALQVDAALPAEVTAGDALLLPVLADAATGDDAPVALVAEPTGLLRTRGDQPGRILLDQDGRGRAILALEVASAADDAPSTAALQLRATQGDHRDATHFDLRVIPRGFPHARSQAGTLGGDRQPDATLQLIIPAAAIRPEARLRVFPNMLTQITQGLEGMLQEPHGCFEQTSSTSYPNTMVLALLDSTGYVDPELESTARGLLDRGYDRLVGFECPGHGYEWFGDDPGHQELTAYGLLQFADLARVHDIVEDDMLARTRGYVLDRRDGEGGFRASENALDRYGRAPGVIRNAWSTYALLHAGEPAVTLQSELDALESRSRISQDPYELALIGCALGLAERPLALDVRESLSALQQDDGSLEGSTTSITSSGGDDLTVETTALALLAWLGEPHEPGQPILHQASALHAWQWLVDCRKGSGTFGATQATIQALRALTAWSQSAGQISDGDGFLVVRSEDGSELLRRRFSTTDSSALVVDLAPLVRLDGTPRALTLALEDVDLGQAIPWVLDVRYHAEQPADDADAPLRLTTKLPQRAAEGDVVTLRAVVENLLDDRPLPMVCAVLGLPAGLEARTSLLDDLVESGRIAAWETRGREVVLYWRGLDPGASVDVTLECVARFPGSTTGPASRAWLYYAPEARRWTEPLQIDVTPR